MINLIRHEIKRFSKFFLFFILGYMVFLLIIASNQTVLMYQLMNSFILLFTVGIALWGSIMFIVDDFTYKKLLYMKSDIQSIKIIVGRLIIVLILSTIILFSGTIVYNLGLFYYKYNNALEYLQLNLDYVGLLLIDKSFKEWLYPINFLLNILYNTVLLFTISSYYKDLSKYKGKAVSIIIPTFTIVLVNFIVFKVVTFINEEFEILNFNYLEVRRIKAMYLSNGEINFLSVGSLVVYGLITLRLLYLVSSKRLEDRL